MRFGADRHCPIVDPLYVLYQLCPTDRPSVGGLLMDCGQLYDQLVSLDR